MIATFLLVAIVLAFFSIGLGLEDRRVVSGSLAIEAPQERVYELVSDLRMGWPQWSPLVVRGSGVAFEYGPLTSGRGASVSWRGKVVTGSVELTAGTPELGISYRTKTSFGRMTAVGTIELHRDAAATVVTWRDELSVGANPVWKWFARALDGLRQQNLTRGLAALKRLAEHGDELAMPRTAERQSLGSHYIAFVLAIFAAVAFVVDGYSEMHAGRGCDGGTCTVALIMGVVRGAGALILGFPGLWLVIAGARRAVRHLRS